MINELNTFDAIVDYMENFLEKRYQELTEKLDNISQQKNLLPKEKNSIKGKKEEIYRELAEIYRIYESYDLMLRKSTTFERRQIVRLFTTYYKALYKKQFTSIKVGDSFVIASASDLGDNANLEQIDIERLLSESQDACIVLTHQFYTLLDGVNLSRDFSPYTELMPVIKLLVELSINNPNMNDRTRISEALQMAVDNLSEEPKKLQKTSPNTFNSAEEL